jgi:hypothetical protein
MEVFCSQPAEYMNTSLEAVNSSAGYKQESEVSPKTGGPSVVTTALLVAGVVLLCAIGGGLILATVVKRQRNKPTTPEYDDVYAPRESHTSLHLYEEIGEGPPHVTDETYADVGKRPSYLSVQP